MVQPHAQSPGTSRAPEPAQDISERDARGRFTVGHRKRGGRRPGSRNKVTSQSPVPPRAPVPEPGQRDARGRFLAGHERRGGRHVGSLNKRPSTPLLAQRMLLEVMSRAEAEGRDPTQAVRKVFLEGLDCRYGSPFGFIKYAIMVDRDPRKRRRALSKSKRRQKPPASGTVGPVVRNEPATRTPERAPADLGDTDKGKDTSEYIVIDGETYYVVPPSKFVECRSCEGSGLVYLRGRRGPCIYCDGSGSVVVPPPPQRS